MCRNIDLGIEPCREISDRILIPQLSPGIKNGPPPSQACGSAIGFPIPIAIPRSFSHSFFGHPSFLRENSPPTQSWCPSTTTLFTIQHTRLLSSFTGRTDIQCQLLIKEPIPLQYPPQRRSAMHMRRLVLEIRLRDRHACDISTRRLGVVQCRLEEESARRFLGLVTAGEVAIRGYCFVLV